MSNKVVCFGEVLFDVYPEGKKLGGAPFNVTAHLSQLGTDASIISRIGDDEHGVEILKAMSQFNVSRDHVQKDERHPTGLVSVSLNDKGIPSYVIKENSSWDFIACSEKDLKLVSEADALVFGSLACRNKKSRSSLLKLADVSNLNICDLNIRQSYYDKAMIGALLELTHVLKINDEEAEILQDFFKLGKEDFYQSLAQKFGISVIIETKGKDGAVAYSGGRTAEADGVKIQVVDTVGSGDAFLAAFIHYFLKHESLDVCLQHACKLGAFVATQSGAIPLHSDMPKDF